MNPRSWVQDLTPEDARVVSAGVIAFGRGQAAGGNPQDISCGLREDGRLIAGAVGRTVGPAVGRKVGASVGGLVSPSCDGRTVGVYVGAMLGADPLT